MKKTIYDLQVDDECYIITTDGEICYAKITEFVTEHFSEEVYYIQHCYLKDFIAMDNVRITFEECQKIVSRRKALAKIKQRAYELDSGKHDLYSDIIYNHEQLFDEEPPGITVVDYERIYANSSSLVFKTYIAHQIAIELEEDLKVVLGVD